MSESELIAHLEDHRCSDRIEISAKVQFRRSGSEDFRTATMVNFSETGMLLLMNEEYDEGAKFEVQIKEDETISFSVTCVRKKAYAEDNLFGYGCSIDGHHIE